MPAQACWPERAKVAILFAPERGEKLLAVSNPRKTARDRAAYIARHRVNENHGDPLTPGALSRWLLWGESRSLARNTAAFRRRFRLQ